VDERSEIHQPSVVGFALRSLAECFDSDPDPDPDEHDCSV